jgi:hypothetical protein
VLIKNRECSAQILQHTMLDGKVINALTFNNATQTCYICKKTSFQMNDLSMVKTSNKAFYKYGLSTLHTKLRTFDFLLRVAYRIPIKSHQTRKNDKKYVMSEKQ